MRAPSWRPTTDPPQESGDRAPPRSVARKERFLHGALAAEIGQFLGKLLDELRGRAAAIVTKHSYELQRIHHGLTAGVVVGEDKRGGGVLLDVLDALLPFLELVWRVEIVVRGGCPGWPAELALPMLWIAPVQTDVTDAGSEQGSGWHALGVRRLIDVRETNTIVDQRAERFFMHPTRVSHFGYQRELMIGPPQRDQERAVLLGIAEGPGKLHQHAAQLASAMERPQAVLEMRDLRRRERAFVRKLAA